METLRNCLEEMLKFTLDYRSDFDLGLSDDFCSGILADDPGCSFSLASVSSTAADIAEEFAGVPEYPLYKRLSLGLLRSIASGSFCRTYKKISLINEESQLKQKEEEWRRLIFQKGSELVNEVCWYASFRQMLKAESLEKVFPGVNTAEEGMKIFRELHTSELENTTGVVAIKFSNAAAQPSIILASILSGLSYGGVQSLLGLSHTAGSILHAFPPPRSILLSSFMLPYKPQVKGCALSHGARALAKHADRSSDGYWGVLTGSDSNKNRIAANVISHLVTRCCWMNIHIVQPHGEAFEVRVTEGYGARWSQDGTKFIGFLEPYMDDGHSKGWKH